MRVVYIGSGAIGNPTLRALHEEKDITILAVITPPDKPAGRGHRLTPCPIAALARELGLPLLQPRKFREPENLAALQALKPDLFIVFSYGQILPPEALTIPSIAPLNLHASLLPRHRGASPIAAAILEGDFKTGITVMYMSEGLDTGDILLFKEIRIAEDETTHSLTEKLSLLAPTALLEAISLLSAGVAPRIPQEELLATWSPKILKEDAEVDWGECAEMICRRVRAYDPWPVAFSWVPTRGAGNLKRMLRIWRAKPLAVLPEEEGIEPATVLPSPRGQLRIRAGEGAVELLEVQLEGSKRMAVADFLRGFSLPVGSKLGGGS